MWHDSKVFCVKYSLSAFAVVTFAIVIKLFGILHWEQEQIDSSLPPSYLSDYDTVTLQRLSIRPPTAPIPNTTAIILNWSRLSNVVRIVNMLCDESLEDTIATVLVWNNSPQELTEKVYFHLVFVTIESNFSGLVGFSKISMQQWKTESLQLSFKSVFLCSLPCVCAGYYAVLFHPGFFFHLSTSTIDCSF